MSSTQSRGAAPEPVSRRGSTSRESVSSMEPPEPVSPRGPISRHSSVTPTTQRQSVSVSTTVSTILEVDENSASDSTHVPANRKRTRSASQSITRRETVPKDSRSSTSSDPDTAERQVRQKLNHKKSLHSMLPPPFSKTWTSLYTTSSRTEARGVIEGEMCPAEEEGSAGGEKRVEKRRKAEELGLDMDDTVKGR